jgi:hypothetical protein
VPWKTAQDMKSGRHKSQLREFHVKAISSHASSTLDSPGQRQETPGNLSLILTPCLTPGLTGDNVNAECEQPASPKPQFFSRKWRTKLR